MRTASRNRETGQFEVRISCRSCELLRINGRVCHETGCPDAWKDYDRECRWCGTQFLPAEKFQDCCNSECEEAYRT